jgi:hypothetical protein
MAAKYEYYLVVGFSHHIVKVCTIPQKEHNDSNFRVTECDSGRCLSNRKVGTVRLYGMVQGGFGLSELEKRSEGTGLTPS